MQLDIPALIKTLSEPNIATLSLCRVSPPTSFLEAVTCVFSCKLLDLYHIRPKNQHISACVTLARRVRLEIPAGFPDWRDGWPE